MLTVEMMEQRHGQSSPGLCRRSSPVCWPSCSQRERGTSSRNTRSSSLPFSSCGGPLVPALAPSRDLLGNQETATSRGGSLSPHRSSTLMDPVKLCGASLTALPVP